jgi:hypothetical protein
MAVGDNAMPQLLYPQERELVPILKVADSSETRVTIYPPTWCHIPEDKSLPEHCYKKLHLTRGYTYMSNRWTPTSITNPMWCTATTCCPSELWMCSSPSLRLANAQFPTTSLACPGRESTGWLGVLGLTCARARWSFSRNSPRFSVT